MEDCNYYPLEKIHVLLLRSFKDVTESSKTFKRKGLRCCLVQLR